MLEQKKRDNETWKCVKRFFGLVILAFGMMFIIMILAGIIATIGKG
jgi:hypothetical protein